MIPADDPRHGTYPGYITARCRCGACKRANYVYRKNADLRRLRNGSLTVPADRAREHIDQLVNLGIPYAEIVRAGVCNPEDIHQGKRQQIHLTTERQVLSIEPIPGENWFPKHGAVRRLRALVAIGHAQKVLAERLGFTYSQLSEIVGDYRPYAPRPDTWKRIAALYEELSMKPGESARSRNRGTRLNWAPPLAWDDIDRDEAPQGTGYKADGRGATIDLADLELFDNAGYSALEVSAQLRMEPKTLHKWATRNGQLDLYERLARRSRVRENGSTVRGAA